MSTDSFLGSCAAALALIASMWISAAAAHGQSTMPMMPGGQPMMPGMPMGRPMMPGMPMGQPMMPMMPGMPMGQPMMPGMPQARPMQPMDMLKLSDEQRAQMATIAQETQATMMTIVKDMYTQSGTLRSLFQAMPPDPKSIGDAYGKMFDLQRQVIETNVGAFNRYFGVLNEEQQKTWESMRNAMMSHHGAMPR